MKIQEIEEELEIFFRSLVKTRVTLLNLCRLKSSEATSTSANSICANLASLGELHEGINNMIQMPSIQQALSNEQGESWMNELLEGSLGLVDLCGFSRDIFCLTKESVQDLESSIRRNKGEVEEINAYVASRKNIIKKVNKCIKNLKSFNQNSTSLLNKDDDLKAIAKMLKETEALDLSVLKSVLTIVSGEKKQSKQRNWSLLSKFTNASRVHSEVEQEQDLSLDINKSRTMQNTLKQLKASEITIQEIEEGLEIFFRSLVKTRVTLLNSSYFHSKFKMATNFHSRSNSFPSTSHPVMDDVEDQLCRLKSSDATSTSATSICSNLASLRDLHENINNMIQLPSIQQALYNEQGESWMNELLEGSLSLVDLCGFSRDILCLSKESVQDLESSIRRNRGEDMNAYMASRKMIIKKVNKCIKNLKSFNQNSTSVLLHKDDDLKAIATMLQATEALDLSVLKSVLTLMSAEKERSKLRSWSLFSKSSNTSRVHSEVEQEADLSLNINKSRTTQNTLKQLKASEMTIQEIEEGLETFFRSLVKTRVTLLNVLSN
ncbi:hypothetical protein ACJIZ3_024731 [Penstemon smallii]|uniref:Uncharacterized protein n=1 Tax=Penstemon smallii TaxID=265156 RepID=A0ABD3TT14_9LAMI